MTSFANRRRTVPAAALVALLVGCAPASAGAALTSAAATFRVPHHLVSDTGTVRVTGTASVSVVADQARLGFAVETQAADASEASQANARDMTAVLAAVRAALGDDGDISTEGYGLYPEYSRPEPGEGNVRRIVGYRATNNVKVTVADLELVAPVLDAAVAAGANRVTQLEFVAGDTRSARLEAIRLATERATEEGSTLAAALGAQLGAVVEVYVSPEDQGGPGVMRMAMMESADVSTPLEAGSQVVQVTVSVTWLLAPGSR